MNITAEQAAELLNKIVKIKADLNDFDGDTRGHKVALWDAQEKLEEAAPDLARALIASEAARKLAEERLAKAMEALQETRATALDLYAVLVELLAVYGGPDKLLCCDGRGCSCQGATTYQRAEYYANAALAAAQGVLDSDGCKARAILKEIDNG